MQISSTDKALLIDQGESPARSPGDAKPAGFASVTSLWHRFHQISPFGSNVALTMGTNVLLATAGLVTGPICARLLGPAGRGELAAIQNLYWLVATLGMLGMPEATLYFTARQPANAGRILSSSVILALIAFPFSFLAVYHIVPILLAAQSPSVIATARWCLLGIPLYALTVIPMFSLRGSNDLVRWNSLRCLPALGWLLLLFLVPFLTRPTPRILAGSYLGVLAITLLPACAVIRTRTAGPFAPDARSWFPMLRYGLPLAGAMIPLTLNLRLDQMLMAGLLPAASLGLYVVAVSWSGAVSPLLVAIGTVTFPRVAKADAVDRPLLIAKSVRLSVMAAVILSVAISLLTPIAIPLLFGRPFEKSVMAGVVLVFASGISGINVVLEEGLRGLGKPTAVLWGECGGLLITALSLVAMLRPLGILGAGIASFFGYFATLAFLVFQLSQSTGVPLAHILIPSADDFRALSTKQRALWASLASQNASS